MLITKLLGEIGVACESAKLFTFFLIGPYAVLSIFITKVCLLGAFSASSKG
jgi:hypothetical protein